MLVLQTLRRERMGEGAAGHAAGEQAPSEERALQGAVAVDAAAAEARRLPGGIQTRERLTGGLQHPALEVRLETAERLSGEDVEPDRDERPRVRVQPPMRRGNSRDAV